MRNRPYNAVVIALHGRFGPMQGSYVGPYPNRGAALGALKSAAVIEVEDLNSDRVSVGGRTIALDRGVGSRLLGRTYLRGFDKSDAEDVAEVEAMCGVVTAAVYMEQCLILRVPEYYPPEGGIQPALIVLIDADKGRPFAYFTEGNVSLRFPPVTWD